MELSTFYRKKKLHQENELNFQAFEWLEMDSPVETDEIDGEEQLKYTIKIFGVTENGDSVLCNVLNFTPFFYVKVPFNWGQNDVREFIDNLCSTPTYRYRAPYNNLFKFKKNILIDKCVLQIKKDFLGFNNGKQCRFLRLTFDNLKALKTTLYKINDHNNQLNKTRIKNINFDLKLYETNLDGILRFIHIKELEPCGFISVKNIIHEVATSTCQIEVSVNWNDVYPFTDGTKTAKILQASFDIETYSHDDSFPSPDDPRNEIFQMATSFKRFGEKDFYMQHVLALKCCDPLQEKINGCRTFLKVCKTEKELLIAWIDLIKNMSPDIMYTWNGDQFDCNYIVVRCIFLGIGDYLFNNLGRLKDTPCSLIDASFSSSAHGTTEFKRLRIPGILMFDLMIHFTKVFKENYYKLDKISEIFLGENKHPITPNMMFDAYRKLDPVLLKDVMEYCLQDTLLPQKLSDKLHILQDRMSMSNVTFVPLKYILEKGEQIKVFSQILRKTRKEGYLVPLIKFNREEELEKFTGATVLTPKEGAYFEPVTVCDFASLYPSIIRAHNFCYSTIVLDPQYENLEGIKYNDIKWNDKHGDHHVTFVDESSQKGILPIILDELSKSRSMYKRLMKEATNEFEKQIYNTSQLAVKISMNSVYGFLAAHMLKCKPIAASVTAIGRKMIIDTRDFIQSRYNSSVAVYGDSVTGSTPLLVKHRLSNNISIKTIMELNEIWDPMSHYAYFDSNQSILTKKEQNDNIYYQVWSDMGWTDIHRVIRHRCEKKIYRVSTENSVIEVTEDHSLLNTEKKKVKPKDLEKGSSLLSIKCFPKCEKLNYYNFLKEVGTDCGLFYLWGFICRNGLFSENTLNISCDDVKILENIHFLLQKYEKDYNSNIFGKSIYITENSLVNKYRSIFYLHGEKVVPELLINIDFSYSDEFIKGYTSNNSNKNEISTQKFEQSIRYLMNKNNNNKDLIEDKIIEIKDITDTISTESYYVYDLETSIGRFHAGVGSIVVSNTDSVFIKFHTETSQLYLDTKERINNQTVITENDNNIIIELRKKCIDESIKLGIEAAELATKHLFKEPISLEYEKVYCPLMMLSKKRYIGEYYSKDSSKYDKIDNKGVVLTRRDNTNLLKKMYKHILDIYRVKGKDGNKEVLEYIHNSIESIKNKKIDLKDLVLTKTLKGDYKNGNLPHVTLAKKITERDPNNKPRRNERISYLFVDTGIVKKTSQYTKVEEPEYVEKNNLPLDIEYYITSIMKPLCEILELFMDDPEKIFKKYIKDYKDARKMILAPPKPKVKPKPRVSKKTKKV